MLRIAVYIARGGGGGGGAADQLLMLHDRAVAAAKALALALERALGPKFLGSSAESFYLTDELSLERSCANAVAVAPAESPKLQAELVNIVRHLDNASARNLRTKLDLIDSRCGSLAMSAGFRKRFNEAALGRDARVMNSSSSVPVSAFVAACRRGHRRSKKDDSFMPRVLPIACIAATLQREKRPSFNACKVVNVCFSSACRTTDPGTKTAVCCNGPADDADAMMISFADKKVRKLLNLDALYCCDKCHEDAKAAFACPCVCCTI
jgi:hypothetical protein